MEYTTKKYYLETNALYSLVNHMHLFVDCAEVATSLFAYDELISGIDPAQYHRRKVLISKMKESGLKIYPYLPIECIAISFGLDISKCPIIVEKKMSLWKRVNLVITSNDYSKYVYELQNKGVDLKEKQVVNDYERANAKVLNAVLKDNHSELLAINERRRLKPEYYKIKVEDLLLDSNQKPNYEREREMLTQVLNACSINYDEADLENAVRKYDGRQLVAFILGKMLYIWNRSYYLKQAGINDVADLEHLLYLKDENYVIVSNDKIFNHSTMAQNRIGSDDFLAMFK